jgi:hypothetical protein
MGGGRGRWLGTAGLLVLGLVGGGAGAQPRAAAPDTRQRIVVPAPARDQVLAEMRLMLESIHAVLRSVVAGDLAGAEQAARAAGTVVATELDPRIMRELPPAFRELGLQTHRGFDALADRLRAGGGRDEAIQALAGLTGQCVACHATWRLDEAR